MSIATLHRFKKAYVVDARLWWLYASIYCPECGVEIDPKRELPKLVRTRLAKKGHALCPECREKVRKRNAVLAVKKWRANNRDRYNQYMRDYRRNDRNERPSNGDATSMA